MNNSRHILVIAKSRKGWSAVFTRAPLWADHMFKVTGEKLRLWPGRFRHGTSYAQIMRKMRDAPRQLCARVSTHEGLGLPKSIQHVQRHGRGSMRTGLNCAVAANEISGFATPVTLN